MVIGSRVPTQFADVVRQAYEREHRSVGYLIRRALRNELERVRNNDADEHVQVP
jgi:Ribbon-helix-helix protein, copG family